MIEKVPLFKTMEPELWKDEAVKMNVSWKSCLRIGASLFLLYLCINFWPKVMEITGVFFGAAMPLLIGCIIAYLVNILMCTYERHYFVGNREPFVEKSRRPVCMLGAFLTLAAVVYLIIRLIVPQLWSCVEIMIVGIPGTLQDLVAFLEEYEVLPEDVTVMLAGVDWKSKMEQIVQALTSGLGSLMDVVFSAVTSVFSWIVSGLLSLIFAIYLLLGKETLSRQMKKVARYYLKASVREKAEYVLSVADDCFHKYIVGQCVEAVIIGGLCSGGMLLLRLPYATMIGALVGFTALIPVAGAYIGAGVGAFMILTVEPVKALVFLVFILVLQQVEGHVIYPKVVGSSMGLPGIWVLAAVTVGGGMMGIPGMLLGVPLAATVYRLIQSDVNRIGPKQESEIILEE